MDLVYYIFFSRIKKSGARRSSLGGFEDYTSIFESISSLSFPLPNFFKEDQGREQGTSNSFKNQDLGARRTSLVKIGGN